MKLRYVQFWAVVIPVVEYLMENHRVVGVRRCLLANEVGTSTARLNSVCSSIYRLQRFLSVWSDGFIS